MVAVRKKVFDEAITRLEELTEKYNLNPHILKYFMEGNLYYSYLTCGGFMGSLDKISYDPQYEKAAKDFEKKHKGYLVYHAIESNTALFARNR